MNCDWSQWGAWSECDATSGTCQKSRKRTKIQEAKNGGQVCSGSDTEQSSCNEGDCAQEEPKQMGKTISLSLKYIA